MAWQSGKPPVLRVKVATHLTWFDSTPSFIRCNQGISCERAPVAPARMEAVWAELDCRPILQAWRRFRPERHLYWHKAAGMFRVNSAFFAGAGGMLAVQGPTRPSAVTSDFRFCAAGLSGPCTGLKGVDHLSLSNGSLVGVRGVVRRKGDQLKSAVKGS